jgi:hypothetical protein
LARELLGGIAVEAEGVLFTLVTKENPVTAVSLLKTGHDAAPMPPLRRYRIVTKRVISEAAGHATRLLHVHTPQVMPEEGLEPTHPVTDTGF